MYLSKQELIDCAATPWTSGCNGGIIDDAFEYAIDKGGLCVDSEYPYLAITGTCKTSQYQKYVPINSIFAVTPNDEEQLRLAVANQPVSAVIEADDPAFQ